MHSVHFFVLAWSCVQNAWTSVHAKVLGAVSTVTMLSVVLLRVSGGWNGEGVLPPDMSRELVRGGCHWLWQLSVAQLLGAAM
jgi:hypothetical protein